MTETETKFLVRDLSALAARLDAAGAQLTAPRVYEHNLRFDWPDGRLAQALEIVRLRQDRRVRLTFKGPAHTDGELHTRPEVEFEAGNFEAARAFLEALGMRVSFIYEKYRTTYEFAGTEVVLDETPLGQFVEIEGPDAASIRAAANQLQLDWARRLDTGYIVLFEGLRDKLGFDFRDMTFTNFAALSLTPALLGGRFAD